MTAHATDERIRRDALAGDVEAARRLARSLERHAIDDQPLRRRLARIMLDAGDPFRAEVALGQRYSPISQYITPSRGTIAEPDQITNDDVVVCNGYPVLLQPVRALLSWTAHTARQVACDAAVIALEQTGNASPALLAIINEARKRDIAMTSVHERRRIRQLFWWIIDWRLADMAAARRFEVITSAIYEWPLVAARHAVLHSECDMNAIILRHLLGEA